MKRALLLFVAILAGFGASELISRSSAARQMIRQWRGPESETSPALENLRRAAASQAVSATEIEREVNLLRAQYQDEKILAEEMDRSGLSLGELRAEVTENLRERQWLEQEIAPQLAVAPNETQDFYDNHPERFEQPPCYRARHLFLAAPEGSRPELIAEKQSAIQGLAVRMLAGEPFAQLVAEASEDEASKLNGGDLNYFAAARVPPEFFAEIEKLQPGQMSAPFRSHLGFHIVQLIDAKAPDKLSLADAQPEIVNELTNEKRARAVAQLGERLSAGRAP